MRIGIAGAGGIGLAMAVDLGQRGHSLTLWSPRGGTADVFRICPLVASGLIEAECAVAVAASAADLVAASDVVIIAVPVNGHRSVIEALAPHIGDAMTVIVSSTASLSALYLHECLVRLGCAATVAAFGTTVLTARRTGAGVAVLTRRQRLGVSALPAARAGAVLALCAGLFGDVFSLDANVLASTLVNVNPIAHGPLALLNWTRIERGEAWPQYHYMTPHVAGVIKALDGERIATAAAFDITIAGIEAHFARSFGTTAADLAGIAAELHARRGGPPGPTALTTRFLGEDIPFGLVFLARLGRLAGVPTPATDAVIAMASLAAGVDFAAANDLIAPLRLEGETRAGLLARV